MCKFLFVTITKTLVEDFFRLNVYSQFVKPSLIWQLQGLLTNLLLVKHPDRMNNVTICFEMHWMPFLGSKLLVWENNPITSVTHVVFWPGCEPLFGGSRIIRTTCCWFHNTYQNSYKKFLSKTFFDSFSSEFMSSDSLWMRINNASVWNVLSWKWKNELIL